MVKEQKTQTQRKKVGKQKPLNIIYCTSIFSRQGSKNLKCILNHVSQQFSISKNKEQGIQQEMIQNVK